MAQSNLVHDLSSNAPPLSELLIEETEVFRARIADRVASAKDRAVVATEEDAEKATLLVAMCRELYLEVDKARTDRNAPYLKDWRTINDHFADLVFPLVGEKPKEKLGGAAGELHARLDAYRKRKEAEAQSERLRLEAEARRQREAEEAAENKRRAAEEAQARAASEAERERARRQKVEAELDARRAADSAVQFEARADAARAPAVIYSGHGPRAIRRANYRVEITDLGKALRHCLKVDKHKIREAVQAIYDGQLRAGIRELPGAEVVEDSITQVRR